MLFPPVSSKLASQWTLWVVKQKPVQVRSIPACGTCMTSKHLECNFQLPKCIDRKHHRQASRCQSAASEALMVRGRNTPTPLSPGPDPRFGPICMGGVGAEAQLKGIVQLLFVGPDGSAPCGPPGSAAADGPAGSERSLLCVKGGLPQAFLWGSQRSSSPQPGPCCCICCPPSFVSSQVYTSALS